MKRQLSVILFLASALSGFLFMSIPAQAAPRLQSYGEELVLVIDPGHGGGNLGTTQNGHEEKTMSMVTAQAMYDELIQYDNVSVYLTRTGDKDLDLEERAEFAKSVDADFLFSIHYNASENHTHWGTEIWIPLNPPFNAYGYQFGYTFLTEMEDMGLFLRGIKTRRGDNGDYYGIIRHSVARDIPAVILEHCHVDEERDDPFCQTEEDWKAFGKKDALAVAKYFGLSSKKLGVDYSQESLNLPNVNESVMVPGTLRDETDPDVCILELKEAAYNSGEVSLTVTATDYDTPLLYYDYSLDGGNTFCTPIAWPGVDLLKGIHPDTFTLSLKIPSGMQPEIVLRAYNLADLYLESNKITFLQSFLYDESQPVTEAEESQPVSSLIEQNRPTAGTTTFIPEQEAEEEAEKDVSFLTFLKLCLGIVVVIFFAVVLSQALNYSRRKKKRRQRIKELEKNRNQRK